ncbi:uncharacterized protein LOC123507180 [Portunus trituberculatus]|uniref:uncharacterized protein LOC123507180 n=1 Tax=Portunus trituberculatus TaxID=210409 RepID=UPI001E1D1A13|nr:uncharacterized protein LOC123507180 [Portunus trituberculatus]
MKHEAWDEIAYLITASHPMVIRTKAECEKRWYTVQSKAKESIAKYKKGVVGTGGGPATPTLDAITQFIYDILGEGNVTFQGITTGLDTNLESVKVLVVDRLEEVDCAGAPTTTSLPCLPLPDAEGPPQDSFVMEALEEESEVPPPKKRQNSVWDQPEEGDEVTLQKKKLKLDIECLERKHKVEMECLQHKHDINGMFTT